MCCARYSDWDNWFVECVVTLVVRFDVLTVMLLDIQDFWDVMFCQCLSGSPFLKAHALLLSVVRQSKNR